MYTVHAASYRIHVSFFHQVSPDIDRRRAFQESVRVGLEGMAADGAAVEVEVASAMYCEEAEEEVVESTGADAEQDGDGARDAGGGSTGAIDGSAGGGGADGAAERANDGAGDADGGGSTDALDGSAGGGFSAVQC